MVLCVRSFVRWGIQKLLCPGTLTLPETERSPPNYQPRETQLHTLVWKTDYFMSRTSIVTFRRLRASLHLAGTIDCSKLMSPGPVCRVGLARHAVETCEAPKLHFSTPVFCQEPRSGLYPRIRPNLAAVVSTKQATFRSSSASKSPLQLCFTAIKAHIIPQHVRERWWYAQTNSDCTEPCHLLIFTLPKHHIVEQILRAHRDLERHDPGTCVGQGILLHLFKLRRVPKSLCR